MCLSQLQRWTSGQNCQTLTSCGQQRNYMFGHLSMGLISQTQSPLLLQTDLNNSNYSHNYYKIPSFYTFKTNCMQKIIQHIMNTGHIPSTYRVHNKHTPDTYPVGTRLYNVSFITNIFI